MIKKRVSLLIVLYMLTLTVDIVSAGATISLDELQKDVPIGGTVDFTVILKSTYVGTGVLAWRTDDKAITATLNGGILAKSGNIDVSTPPSAQTFILTVAAGSGAIVDHMYNIQINYCYSTQGSTPYETQENCEGNTAIARAEADVIPTPELDTIILTSAGLIGLFGLIRFRRGKVI